MYLCKLSRITDHYNILYIEKKERMKKKVHCEAKKKIANHFYLLYYPSHNYTQIKYEPMKSERIIFLYKKT